MAIQKFHIPVSHPDTSGAGGQADGPGAVGAVDSVLVASSDAQAHPAGAQRIVRMASGNFFAHVIGLMDFGCDEKLAGWGQISTSSGNRKGILGNIIHDDHQQMPFFVNSDINLLLMRRGGSRK